MAQDLLGTTGAIVHSALNLASLRQQAGAINIANASMPGFAPVRVTFDQALSTAVDNFRRSGEFAQPQLHVFQETGVSANGESLVKTDAEAAQLNVNALQYQALLKGLRGQLDLLQTAVNDGRK